MKALADFRNIHAGQSIIVCGLGPSLHAFNTMCAQDFITIGVNDIGRYFNPKYLVLLNREASFTPERWRYIAKSDADFLFTCNDMPWPELPDVVRFKLDNRPGIHLDSDDSLPFSNTSPYVAVALAAYMGASKIGLIGVDFIDHKLSRDLKRINRDYGKLREAIEAKGATVVNLSQQSRLEAIPKMLLEDFIKL